MNYIILTSLGGLCIFFSCMHLLPDKPSRIWRLAMLICVLTSSCILNYSLGQYYAFITIAIAPFLIYHSTTLRWLNLSCALFGYLFTVALNYLYIWLSQVYFATPLEEMYQNPQFILFIALVYCFICYVCTSLLGYLLNTRLKISTFLINNDLNKTLFVTVLLLTVFFVFNFSYGDELGYSYGVTAFNGILFLSLFIFITILMWFLYRNIQQKQQAKAMLLQYEHLQTYTRELEKLYGSMRSFKHDYINILSALCGYIEENDMPGLKNYFYSEIPPISRTFSESDTKLGSLSYIEILELKTLLSNKIIYAMELGIHVDLTISEPVRDIPISIMDATRVIGIFFDNAIDAALKTDEKLIQVCFLYKEEQLRFVLRNSSESPPVPLSKLNDWGVSSKGDHRGIGLYNAKNILTPYNNILWETEYRDSQFTQSLIILPTGRQYS